ncbi:MAG: (2Fe-2S)-binding protein [Treponema sp.]|jgi:NADH-quinone oxidoreductase subunit G/NADP-reducing hydrogenase subunit HndD|nr:(2Fe-2S)-binding protein [Treponema sp.]
MSNHQSDNKNVNLFIDDIPVTVAAGTTIIEAARKVNVKIPTLCDHPALGKRAVCRICVVECDGRGKLLASCSQDVWEGVHVVTNNRKLMSIRKTILDLILAKHPQECLSCARSGACELQNLAETYNKHYTENKDRAENQDAEKQVPESSAGVLSRNMSKCVKCGRCVDVCQNVQAVRAINTGHRSLHYEICTPYQDALEKGPCVYCGLCVQVCPVGAIVECDQAAEVQAALNKSGQRVITQITDSTGMVIDNEFKLPPGTITKGKIVAALKLMGFDKVFDAAVYADQYIRERSVEFLDRIKSSGESPSGKLPMVLSCSPALNNFVDTFYPELRAYLTVENSLEQSFGALAKTWYNKTFKIDLPEITYVSIMPCTAKKYEAHRDNGEANNVNLAISASELARMIRMAGIDLINLPEAPLDSLVHNSAKSKFASDTPEAEIYKAIVKVFEAYTTGQKSGETAAHYDSAAGRIIETVLNFQGKSIKILTVSGLGSAHKIMDSILKGKCDADLVHIISCPLGCGSVAIP